MCFTVHYLAHSFFLDGNKKRKRVKEHMWRKKANRRKKKQKKILSCEQNAVCVCVCVF